MVLSSFSGIYALTQDQNHKTIYVAKNGTDRNDGLSPLHPKRNIVNAIDSANAGDTVVVGAGVYSENLVITKDLTLIGNSQETSVIDGCQVGRCIKIEANITVKIVGFTIKNGLEDGGGGIRNCGGILTLENLTIRDSSARYGGGIANKRDGLMTLNRVTIKKNHGREDSSGISNEGIMTIENSTITENNAHSGAGIFNWRTMTIIRSTIKGNSGVDSAGIWNHGSLTVMDSEFIDNIAETEGAGIYNCGTIHIYGTNFTNNIAAHGGGIMNYFKAYLDDSTISHMNNNSPNNFEGIPYIPA